MEELIVAENGQWTLHKNNMSRKSQIKMLHRQMADQILSQPKESPKQQDFREKLGIKSRFNEIKEKLKDLTKE